MKDYTHKKFSIVPTNAVPQEIRAALKDYLNKYILSSEADEYLSNRNNESYEHAAFDYGSALIEFIYDKIEKRRRESMGQMLSISRAGELEGEQSFRGQILAFLERSNFTERIENLSEEPKEWFGILDSVEKDDDITKLLGACRRKLSENPDHIGVRLLEGLCLFTSPSPEQGPGDIYRVFADMRDKSNEGNLMIADQFITYARNLIRPEYRDNNLNMMLKSMLNADLSLAKVCYKHAGVDSEAHHQAVLLLLMGTLESLRSKV
jgi:hypothetical protein